MSYIQVRVFDTDLFLLAKGSSGIETAFGSSSASCVAQRALKPWVNTLGTWLQHSAVAVLSLSPVWLSATPWTIAHRAPPSMGFPRQEYWGRLPVLSPGFSRPRDLTCVSCIGRWLFYHWAPGRPDYNIVYSLNNHRTIHKSHDTLVTQVSHKVSL